MSTAVTMQDLELETAELLPNRETLCCVGGRLPSYHQVNILSGNAVNISVLSLGGNQQAIAGNYQRVAPAWPRTAVLLCICLRGMRGRIGRAARLLRAALLLCGAGPPVLGGSSRS